MPFEILDTLSLPGDPAQPNDDAFGHTDNAAVVLDGATSLGDPLMPGASDAAWIAHFGARRLMAHVRDGETPKNALRFALADTKKSFEALCRRPIKEKWETPLASMMFVCELPFGFDALAFGDCVALVKRPDAKLEIIGDAFESKTAESQRAAKLAKENGLVPASGANRPEYLPALRASRNRVNSGRNWAFSPDPRAAEHVAEQRVVAPRGTILLLASDGFLALASDYGAHTAEALMEAALKSGLGALAEELRAIEESDPQGHNFPRFKKSDDATAVLLKLI